MAVQLGELAVLLTANAAKFNASMGGAAGRLKSFSKIAKTTAKVSGAIFGGLTAAIGLATRALGEQREAEQRLAAVAGLQDVNVGRVHEYAAALQDLTTFGDEVTISATAMLASFNLTEGQLIKLMPRMQNLAAFAKQDLNQVAMQMGKAFTMGAGALSRMGIVMTDVQREAFNAANQMGKVAIMAEVIDANVGNAAQTMAQTAVGAFKQLQNAAGDTLEELGKFVELPLTMLFQGLAAAISDVNAWFQELSPETKSYVTIAIAATVALTGLVAVVAALGLALPAVAAALPVVGAMIGGVGMAVLPVITLIDTMRSTWLRNLSLMLKAISGWITKVIGLMEPITGLLAAVAPGAIVAGGGLGGLRAAADAAAGFADSLIGLGDGIGTVVTDIKDKFSGFKDAIDEAVSSASAAASSQADVAKESEAAAVGLKAVAEAIDTSMIPSMGDIDKARADVMFGGAVGGAGEGFAQTGLTKMALGGAAAPAAAMSDAEAVAQQIGAVADIAGDTAMQAVGKFGDTISAATQGFQAGGPYAAAIAAFAQLATQTESFGRIIESVNEVFDILIAAIEPVVIAVESAVSTILKSLTPVIETIGSVLLNLTNAGLGPLLDAVGLLVQAVMPIVNILLIALQPVFEVLGYILRGLSVVIGGVAVAIGWVVNAVIDFVSAILDVIAAIADIFGAGGEVRKFKGEIRSARVDLDEMGKGLEQAATGAKNFAAATGLFATVADNVIGPILDAQQTTSAVLKDEVLPPAQAMAETFKDISESLSNVPQGFKVAAARFEAMDADGSAALGDTSVAPKVGTITVIAADAREVYEKIVAFAEEDQFLEGTSVTGAAPWAVERNGS